MNFSDIENMWRSPLNRPTAAELEQQKMHFVADLRRRHRGNVQFLILTGLPLVIFTTLVVRHLLWPDPAHTPVDLRREWAIIPFYLLPWIGWIFIIRLHQRHCARHRHHDQSVSASVAALLDENRSERTRYKFVGGLLLASVLVLPLVIHQLRVVGKAGDEILLPGFVFAPALILGIAIWMAVYFRRKLLPRKRDLEALLASYHEPPPGPGPA